MNQTRTLPSEMTVGACTADGNLRIEHRPTPDPGPGEFLLRLTWCGFCGTDLFKLDNRTEPDGTVLGHEVVGTVAALGENVESFDIGDRIVVPHHVACGRCALCRRGARTMCPTFKENLMTPGGLAEFVLIGGRAAREAARRIPDDVTDEAAVFLEPSACVLRGIDMAGISPGLPGCAVVIGGGSMGLLHLLVLRALFPDLAVVVSDPIDERRSLARRLGAAGACTPEDLSPAVEHLSEGLGADAVFDTVGGAAVLDSALGILRPGGTVVLFAHAAKGETSNFEINPLFKNERRVVATYSGSLDEQDRIAELLFSSVFDPRPLITHRLPLERAQHAVDLARARTALKILLGPGNQR